MSHTLVEGLPIVVEIRIFYQYGYGDFHPIPLVVVDRDLRKRV